MYLVKKNKWSLPDAFSNKGLEVLLGRELTQQSTEVAGEDSISMSGISKISQKTDLQAVF